MSEPTSKATIAGILDLASGVSGLIGGAVLVGFGLLAGAIIASAAPPDAGPVALIPGAVLVPLGVLLFLSGVIAVAGGVAAIRRRSWLLVIAGAVASLVVFLPLGIPALIFTVLAEPEFRRGDR
jgi:hypothetical protein